MLGLFQCTVKVFGIPWTYGSGHKDYHIVKKNLNFRADFFWSANMTNQTNAALTGYSEVSPEERPTMLILGAALWSIRDSNYSAEALREYRVNITAMLPALRVLRSSSLVLWREQYPIAEFLRYRSKNWKRNWNFVTNAKVRRYNQVAEDIL